MYIWIFFVFLILSPIMLVSLTLSLLLFLNTLLHVFSNKNCRLHSRPAWERERERERDGQRFIDMSFQSTVYPSEEMYLCTVGGISICCKISRNNTAWSPQYCTVFSLADLFALSFSHTHVHIKNKAANKIHPLSFQYP